MNAQITFRLRTLEGKLINIPVPQDTGATGTQEQKNDSVSLVESPQPPEGMIIADRVNGLASTNSRSLGGEVAAGLISSTFTQMSHDLQDAKSQIRYLTKELKTSEQGKHEWKEKASVLQERVEANQTIRTLGNISITLGTALLGIGIELYRNNLEGLSYLISAIGGSFILLGWLSGRRGKE
jgi:hypothetical protein